MEKVKRVDGQAVRRCALRRAAVSSQPFRCYNIHTYCDIAYVKLSHVLGNRG